MVYQVNVNVTIYKTIKIRVFGANLIETNYMMYQKCCKT